MTTKVLVTGATGYLGGRLTSDWLGAADVTAIAPARAELAGTLERWVDGCDAVLHLAGPNEIVCAAEPARALSESLELTQRLLDAARAVGAPRFFYASSIRVLGDALAESVDETTEPQPNDDYGHIKRAHELAVAAVATPGTCVLRFTTLVGPLRDPSRPRWTPLVNDLCRQAVESGRLRLHTDGLQSRDFLSMGQAVAAVRTLVGLDPRVLPTTLHVASGHSRLVRDVADLVADRARQLLGAPITLERAPDRDPPLPRPTLLDVGLLRELGISLEDRLEEEIDGTLELCRKIHDPT